MRILITGICGFVGSALAGSLLERCEGVSICGIDNLMRPGAEINRAASASAGRRSSSTATSAAPAISKPSRGGLGDRRRRQSQRAGRRGRAGPAAASCSSTTLASLVNMLEYCKTHRAGLLLLSSSRVYSIPALVAPAAQDPGPTHFVLDTGASFAAGASRARASAANFSTQRPSLALRQHQAGLAKPWRSNTARRSIFRYGSTAAACWRAPGQFGTPDQGIFAYWINAHLRRRPLRYIGFGGPGNRCATRSIRATWLRCLAMQMRTGAPGGRRIYTAGGGPANAMSLAQLTAWCDARFGAHAPERRSARAPLRHSLDGHGQPAAGTATSAGSPETSLSAYPRRRSPVTPAASGLAGDGVAYEIAAAHIHRAAQACCPS